MTTRDGVVAKGEARSEDAGFPTEWREMVLGDVTELLSGGTPSKSRGDYWDGSVPWVSAKDMKRLRLHETENMVTAAGLKNGTRMVPAGTVLILVRGMTLLNDVPVSIAQRPMAFNQDIKALRPRPGVAEEFLPYIILGNKARLLGLVDLAGHGTGRLNTDELRTIRVGLPPLVEQRAIAHVLGTLDDKIELNRRMNETLEEMARALFKSWFVDFEPVRAKMEGHWRRGESLPGLPAEHYDLFPDRLVPSELGDIPEGSEVKTLGSLGKIITGKTPSTRNSDFYGVDVPFLRIPDMHGRMYAVTTNSMLSNAGALSQPRQSLLPGSISVSCIATPGLVVLNHRKTHTNQQINSIVPYEPSTSKYLYWSCRHLASEIMAKGSGGSVFQNMNKSTFSALELLDVGIEAISRFDAMVSSVHKMILSNEQQNQHLATLRDTLLPQLVGGEVGIRELTLCH